MSIEIKVRCFAHVKNAIGKALTENVNAERDG